MDHILALATVDAFAVLCPVVAAGLDDWRWRSWEVLATALFGLFCILTVHVFIP